jgi:DNA repair exonuclease SbcCD ATPase subunit
VDLGAAERARLIDENVELRRQLEQQRGELNGLRARVLESELAWQSAFAQGQKLQQRFGSTQDRVNELRSESAEVTLLAQTRAARIGELTQSAAFDQQEIRTLRAQVSAATAAQVAQGEARESDRQLWSERLRQHEEREQAAWSAAAAAVARSEARLREFLGSLERPLRQLDASLDTLGTAGRTEAAPSAPVIDVSTATSTTPATADASSLPAPNGRRIPDELANERDRRTKLVAAVRALQAATQSGEPTTPWIEELVELVSEARPSARRR